MRVRDAVEDDAEVLASLAGVSRAAAVELVHDRTVRVAEEDGTVIGVVAFDARRDAVHLTQLGGEPAALDRLLEEPATFASAEGLPVEAVLPVTETAAVAAVEKAGFEEVGAGPRFEGGETSRFRLEP